MIGNNVLGLVFSNLHGDLIPELTNKRTLGSVPFGGKYRLIDFPISNMVNCGVEKVGVIIKNNYHSLMDHLGSGKAYGLSRRRGGLVLLPPYASNSSVYGNRVQTLSTLKSFISSSEEDYILLSDCCEVCNIDYQKMIDFHIKNSADITIAYKHGLIPKKLTNHITLEMDGTRRVREILINNPCEEPCNFGLFSILIGRQLLLRLINECTGRNHDNFNRDILQANVGTLKIYGYEFIGFDAIINDVQDYFTANMSLMSPYIRNELFDRARPIYTKVRDDMPSKYGLGSNVKNSLIAQGCVIDGEVENSIIFKGVHIGKGTKISNCVIMQDTKIGNLCNLSYVICDKDVVINDNRSMGGYLSYPVCIVKGSVV